MVILKQYCMNRGLITCMNSRVDVVWCWPVGRRDFEIDGGCGEFRLELASPCDMFVDERP